MLLEGSFVTTVCQRKGQGVTQVICNHPFGGAWISTPNTMLRFVLMIKVLDWWMHQMTDQTTNISILTSYCNWDKERSNGFTIKWRHWNFSSLTERQTKQKNKSCRARYSWCSCLHSEVNVALQWWGPSNLWTSCSSYYHAPIISFIPTTNMLCTGARERKETGIQREICTHTHTHMCVIWHKYKWWIK